jgi:hypothetical protein
MQAAFISYAVFLAVLLLLVILLIIIIAVRSLLAFIRIRRYKNDARSRDQPPPLVITFGGTMMLKWMLNDYSRH